MQAPTPSDDQKLFVDFLMEAGAYALAQQDGIKTSFKAGEQALTETDLYISELAQKRLASVIKRDGYTLIDEESIDRAGTSDSVFTRYDNLVILDPIDGTAGYAAGRGYWGIILAHWHKGTPVWGGLYLPAQRTLIVTENGKAIRYINPQSPEQKRTELCAAPLSINSQTFIEVHRTDLLGAKQDILKQQAWVNTPESAIQSAASVLQGMAAASIIPTVYSIWDLAGLMALAPLAGLSVCDMETSAPKTSFVAEDFASSWKLKHKLLVCHPDNVGKLRTLFAHELL